MKALTLRATFPPSTAPAVSPSKRELLAFVSISMVRLASKRMSALNFSIRTSFSLCCFCKSLILCTVCRMMCCNVSCVCWSTGLYLVISMLTSLMPRSAKNVSLTWLAKAFSTMSADCSMNSARVLLLTAAIKVLRERAQTSPSGSAVMTTILETSVICQKIVPSISNLTLSLVRTSYLKNDFCVRKSMLATFRFGLELGGDTWSMYISSISLASLSSVASNRRCEATSAGFA
mmetsp:Transcript_118896/g.343911  ORF Transcript_118896/g.343911 Transcript_118896/m.343911 type:complete len:233 (-) Transcript_118896:912-1610(-)